MLGLAYGGGTVLSTQHLPESEPLKWSQLPYHLATQQKWRCSDPTWTWCPGRTQGWGPRDCVSTSSPGEFILNRSKIHMTKSPLRNTQSPAFMRLRCYTNITTYSRTFSWVPTLHPQKSQPMKQTLLTRTPPVPVDHNSAVSPWICLVGTFRVNGTFQRGPFMSGFFQHVSKGLPCCSTLSTSFISMTE